MKLLLHCEATLTINISLAREIGLYEAAAIMTLYKEIQNHGVKKDGLSMIARNEKQLKELFSWCKPALINKTLDRLQSLNYIYISDNTLFDDGYLYYGLNEQKLKEIKSLVIMSDSEIKESHVPPTVITNSNGHSESRLHRILFGAFLKACHWHNAPRLSEADRREVGAAVKSLIRRYPDHETENLKLMVLGIDTYRKDILKQERPFRPNGILKAWTDYEIYCQKHLNGNPPEPLKD